MGERIIAHWPPPHADEEKLVDTQREIFIAVRERLLDSLRITKKSKIRASKPRQLMYEMSGSCEDDIALHFGILSRNSESILGELPEEEVSELINEKLQPEIRSQMAYALTWTYVYDFQERMDGEEEDDEDDEDPYKLSLWTPEKKSGFPKINHEDLSDREKQLMLVNAVDAQTGLRDFYISLIFGTYGEQNGKNIAS